MKIVLAGFLLLALGAAVPRPAGVGESVEDKSARMQPVVLSPGKRTAPVTMQHEFDQLPTAGVPLVVTMVFTSAGNDALHLELGAEQALGLDRRIVRRVRAGEAVSVPLLPQKDGRYYFSVTARLDDRQVRVFQVPVQVGSKKAVLPARRAKATAGADGELVVIMPASDR